MHNKQQLKRKAKMIVICAKNVIVHGGLCDDELQYYIMQCDIIWCDMMWDNARVLWTNSPPQWPSVALEEIGQKTYAHKEINLCLLKMIAMHTWGKTAEREYSRDTHWAANGDNDNYDDELKIALLWICFNGAIILISGMIMQYKCTHDIVM